MNLIEAAKRALEAHDQALGFTGSREIDAILRASSSRLREAIAEAEKTEPVARKPLTEKEVDECWGGLMPSGHGKSIYDIARALEAKHGIKE